MSKVSKYKHLLDKKIKVSCIDGSIVEGVWMDWTSALDNEPDGESITVERPSGTQIEIFVDEIKDIQEAHN